MADGILKQLRYISVPPNSSQASQTPGTADSRLRTYPVKGPVRAATFGVAAAEGMILVRKAAFLARTRYCSTQISRMVSREAPFLFLFTTSRVRTLIARMPKATSLRLQPLRPSHLILGTRDPAVNRDQPMMIVIY